MCLLTCFIVLVPVRAERIRQRGSRPFWRGDQVGGAAGWRKRNCVTSVSEQALQCFHVEGVAKIAQSMNTLPTVVECFGSGYGQDIVKRSESPCLQ
jgi:hypothetical protein